MAHYMDLSLFIGHIVLHLKLVERVGNELSVPVVLALQNLHDLTGTVFQLLGKYHDGIGLHHDLHEHGVVHAVFALGEGHHPAVSAVAGIGVDGGADGMAGAGALGGRQALCGGPHLADADDIGMFAQHPLQKKVLVDVQCRIFAGPGQQVNDGV